MVVHSYLHPKVSNDSGHRKFCARQYDNFTVTVYKFWFLGNFILVYKDSEQRKTNELDFLLFIY